MNESNGNPPESQMSFEEQEYLGRITSLTRDVVHLQSQLRRAMAANDELSRRLIELSESDSDSDSWPGHLSVPEQDTEATIQTKDDD